MPELPEVQTIVDELNSAISERTITGCKILRPSIIQGDRKCFTRELQNRTIGKIVRRGKYLLFHFGDDQGLVVHLRMTGKFILERASVSNAPHHRVIFHLDDGSHLIFHDVRCFGTLEFVKDIKQFKKILSLGWEPWERRLTTQSLYNKIKNRKTSLKAILLDQTVIAGLGNIYASEILYDATLNPELKGNEISQEQTRRLIRSVRKILKAAMKYNGTTISDYRRVDDKQGTFQNFLKVYGKEGENCPRCSSSIIKIKQNQRSTFLCPNCQS